MIDLEEKVWGKIHDILEQESPNVKHINDQLDDQYKKGNYAVIKTSRRIMPVKKREMIKASSDGKGVMVQNGKKWVYSPGYQVEFHKD